MGTPEFASHILKKLIGSDEIDILAVVTAPDRQAGRGRKIRKSDVKECAESNQIKVLQPTNLKDPSFNCELERLGADLFVVVAFRMLPEMVWSMPAKGTINLHASLLPNYRGAAPINWAIINGETETGVTTFFIEKQIDTGEILEQRKTVIDPNETVGGLYNRLMELGATTTLSTIVAIKNDTIESFPQEIPKTDQRLPSAPKIFKDDCQISFNQEAKQVHNFCRGLSPYPGAWFQLLDDSSRVIKEMKVLLTLLTDRKANSNSKSILIENGQIFLRCADRYIEVVGLQPEGKRRMSSSEFLAGNSLDGQSINVKQE